MNRRRILAAIAAFGVVFSALLLGRALTWPSQQRPAAPVAVEVNADRLATRLSQAVRFPTVSAAHAEAGGAPTPEEDGIFAGFFAWSRGTWPAVYERLIVIEVGRSRHLVWPGTDPAAPHLVILAHIDVVPVEPGTEADWTHPPFDGVIADGFVWGRGTMDNKHNAVAIHEAIDALLAAGHQPKRTVHFVFGADEEVGGAGAAAVAAALRADGVALHAVYDEGLVIGDGLVPGIPGRVGLIGVAEKGYLTVELVATGPGGHSSMPPPGESAVGLLAAAVGRLEANPFPGGLDGPLGLLFDWAGPEMDLGHRVLFANRWLTAPIVKRVMAAKPSSNATLRTTIAPTMLRASVKENVLPQRAVATVNLRLHPRDSVASAVAYLEATINDPRVVVRPLPGSQAEPSRVAAVDGAAFSAIQLSYAEVFPGLPVAPALFIAQTDSRHFNASTDDVYRFQPVPATSEDLARIHGTNERIAVADLARVAMLWQRLVVHASE